MPVVIFSARSSAVRVAIRSMSSSVMEISSFIRPAHRCPCPVRAASESVQERVATGRPGGGAPADRRADPGARTRSRSCPPPRPSGRVYPSVIPRDPRLGVSVYDGLGCPHTHPRRDRDGGGAWSRGPVADAYFYLSRARARTRGSYSAGTVPTPRGDHGDGAWSGGLRIRLGERARKLEDGEVAAISRQWARLAKVPPITRAGRVVPVRCGRAASSRCLRARRCGSATRTGPAW